MIKTIVFLSFLLIGTQSYTQNKTLPEGWDKIILEGKPAYMNLITGDISTTLPTKPALKEKKRIEFDPTISHSVKPGETLSKIARKYNKSLAELYRLNSLENFDHLSVGQEIVVGYSNETHDSVSKKLQNSPTTHHTVKSNETLYSIAKQYQLTVATLKVLNGLTTNTIYRGQQLKIN